MCRFLLAAFFVLVWITKPLVLFIGSALHGYPVFNRATIRAEYAALKLIWQNRRNW